MCWSIHLDLCHGQSQLQMLPLRRHLVSRLRPFWLSVENLIRSSPYSWVTSRKKLERSNNYFSSYRVSNIFFESLPFTFGLCPWPWVENLPGWVECLYELWAQSVAPFWCSSQMALCGGGDGGGGDGRAWRGRQCIYPFGPNGKRDKNDFILRLLWYTCMCVFVNVWWLYTRWNINIQAHSCIIWFFRIFADSPRTKCCCQNYCPGCATDNRWKCCLIWPRKHQTKVARGCNELLWYNLFWIWPMDYSKRTSY